MTVFQNKFCKYFSAGAGNTYCEVLNTCVNTELYKKPVFLEACGLKKTK